MHQRLAWKIRFSILGFPWWLDSMFRSESTWIDLSCIAASFCRGDCVPLCYPLTPIDLQVWQKAHQNASRKQFLIIFVWFLPFSRFVARCSSLFAKAKAISPGSMGVPTTAAWSVPDYGGCSGLEGGGPRCWVAARLRQFALSFFNYIITTYCYFF